MIDEADDIVSWLMMIPHRLQASGIGLHGRRDLGTCPCAVKWKQQEERAGGEKNEGFVVVVVVEER